VTGGVHSRNKASRWLKKTIKSGNSGEDEGDLVGKRNKTLKKSSSTRRDLLIMKEPFPGGRESGKVEAVNPR